VETEDGRIVLLIGNSVGILRPGAEAGPPSPEAGYKTVPPASTRPQRGQLLFTMCRDCHPVTGADHSVGPNLRGVVGRDIAAAPGFEFSNALDKLPGRWTPERLDAFLKDPEAYAPKTAMRTGSIENPETRKWLIDYLATRK
jgi:cytochrome c